MLHNIVKELATRSILHYEIQLFWSFDNFVELDHLWMLHNLQNMYLPRYSLNICDIHNFSFLQNLDGDLCPGKNVHADFDLAEGTFSDSFTQNILSYFAFVWLEL